MSDEVEIEDSEITEPNNQLVLVSGFSGTGKSASLKDIRNQEDWIYCGAEAGKRLPFRSKFREIRVTDPYQIHDAFDYATNDDDSVQGIIIDSVTFTMDMFESLYVLGAADGRAAWGSYQQFFKHLLQQKVPKFGKPVIITAHVLDIYDEKALETRTSVPIKGALKGNGVEAYFSTVVSTKKMDLKDLKDYESDILNITDEDKMLGFKHVFQTRVTKKTTGERIRSPMGLFSVKETFMDNNSQLLLDHLDKFYN